MSRSILVREIVKLMPIKRTPRIIRKVRERLSKRSMVNLKRDYLHWGEHVARLDPEKVRQDLLNKCLEDLDAHVARQEPRTIWAIRCTTPDGKESWVTATPYRTRGVNYKCGKKFKQFFTESHARETIEELRPPVLGTQFEVVRFVVKGDRVQS